ncbi:MAG: diguanylate cyclase (GGDEF)-like protein [Cognaticolwellia sp.]
MQGVRHPPPAILRSLPARRLLLLHQRHHGAARVVSGRRSGRAIQLGSQRVASLECSGPQDACELLVQALEALVEVDALSEQRLEAVRTKLLALVGRVQAADITLQRLIREDREGDRHTEALTAAALRDPLTGLLNRRAFMALAQNIVLGTGVGDEELSVVFLDLDHFKRINDTHGHAAGDAVLVDVADTLRSCARRSDLIARWGGEEFVVLLDSCSLDQGLVFGDRLLHAFRAKEHRLLPADWRVTASIGVATGGVCGDSATQVIEALIQAADERAYAAKRGGRDRVVPDPALGFGQVA